MAQANSGPNTRIKDEQQKVLFGDLVYIKLDNVDQEGHLVGNQILKRLGSQAMDTSNQTFDDASVFQLLPSQNYEAAQALEKFTKVWDTQSKGTVNPDLVHTLERLQRNVEIERRNNNRTLDNVKAGNNNDPIKYGDKIQLFHVKSQYFLTAQDQAACYESRAKKLTLMEKGTCDNSSQSVFMFEAEPSSGQTVSYDDSFRIKPHSITLSKYYVHVSSAAYNEKIPTGSWNSVLPETLRSGLVYECNLGFRDPARTQFIIKPYGRRSVDDAKNVLETGSFLRLYHPYNESFISASLEGGVDHAQGVAAGGVTSNDTAGGGGGGSPPVTAPLPGGPPNARRHVPYEEKLEDNGDNPNAADITHQKAESVWCFEPLQTRKMEQLKWGEYVRVKHIPSGLYLAVDTNHAVENQSSPRNEYIYHTLLVDGSTAHQSPTAEGIHGGMTQFKLSAADQKANTVQNSNILIRLQHDFMFCEEGEEPTKRELYLHSNGELELSASPTSSVSTATHSCFQLVFSTVNRRQENVLKIMVLTPSECDTINKISAIRKCCDLYTYTLSRLDGLWTISPALLKETIQVLLQYLSMQIKGCTSYDCEDVESWTAMSNTVQLSAHFVGEPDPRIQRACRELKLLDSLFAMSLAYYHRLEKRQALLNPSNEDDQGDESAAEEVDELPDNVEDRRQRFAERRYTGDSNIDVNVDVSRNKRDCIQRLVFISIQMACKNNIHSQNYFHRGELSSFSLLLSSTTLPTPTLPTLVPQQGYSPPLLDCSVPNWMNGLMCKLGDDYGNVETLTTLMKFNTNLMGEQVIEALIKYILKMIQFHGPQARFLDCFNVMCTVDQNARNTARAYQEMIIKLSWTDESLRKLYYISTKTMDDIGTYHDSDDYDSMVTSKWKDNYLVRKNSRCVRNTPQEYMGKNSFFEEATGPLFPISVGWLTQPGYTENSTAFFHPPSDLKYQKPPEPDKTSSVKKGNKTRKGLRGSTRSHGSSNACGNNDGTCVVDQRNRWCSLEDLVWVLEPERLWALNTNNQKNEMVWNEAMKTEEWFQKALQLARYYLSYLQFFATLCKDNTHIQTELQEEFTYEILCSMFGNINLPFSIRSAAIHLLTSIYVDQYPHQRAMLNNTLPSQLCDNDHQSLQKEFAVKPFEIGPGHPIGGDTPPECKTCDKFYVLSSLCTNHLKRTAKDSMYSAKHGASFTTCVIELMRYLISLGFLPKKSDINKAVKAVIPVLLAIVEGAGDDKYKQSPSTIETSNLTATIMEFFCDILALRSDAQLQHLNHQLNTKFSDTQIDGAALFKVLENALGPNGDWLSKQRRKFQGKLNRTLAECLLYEDDALVSNCLHLLSGVFSEYQSLMDLFDGVVVFPLLAQQTPESFCEVNTVEQMQVYLGQLSTHIEQLNFSLINLDWDDEFQFRARFKLKSDKCAIKGFMLSQLLSDESKRTQANDGGHFQDVLRMLNITEVLIKGLKMDYNLAYRLRGVHAVAPSSEARGNNSAELICDYYRTQVIKFQGEIMAILQLFVRGNSENQALVFSYLKLLRCHLGPLISPPSCPTIITEKKWDIVELLIDCLRNNYKLCDLAVPRDLVEELANLLAQEQDISRSPILKLFSILCVPCQDVGYEDSDKIHSRNQLMVLDELIGHRDLFQKFSLVFSSTIGYAHPHEVLQCLSNVIRGNMKCIENLQQRGIDITRCVTFLSEMTRVRPARTTINTNNKHLLYMLQFINLLLDEVAFPSELFLHTCARDLLSKVCFEVIVFMDGILSKTTFRDTCQSNEVFLNAIFRIATVLIEGISNCWAAQRHTPEFIRICVDSIKDHLDDQRRWYSFVNSMSPVCEKPIPPMREKPDESTSDETLNDEHHIKLTSKRGEMYKALCCNKEIDKQMKGTYFQLMRLLCENPSPHADKQSENLQWQKIVNRSVKYVRDHNFDSDHGTCNIILKILRYYPMQIRYDAEKDGSKIDALSSKDQTLFKKYVQRQSFLVNLGVVDMAMSAVVSHSANEEGNLADEGLELLIELVNTGNPFVQKAIFRYITEVDHENHFLSHISDRLNGHIKFISLRKAKVGEGGFQVLKSQEKEAIKDTQQTLNFVHQVCEGHNTVSQSLFNNQTLRSKSINIVEMVGQLFVLQCKTGLSLMDEPEIELLIDNLELLVELIQGPHLANQTTLLGIDGLLKRVLETIRSDFHPSSEIYIVSTEANLKQFTLDHEKVLKAHYAALTFLGSCLEGRAIHNKFAAELDFTDLSHVGDACLVKLAELRTQKQESRAVCGTLTAFEIKSLLLKFCRHLKETGSNYLSHCYATVMGIFQSIYAFCCCIYAFCCCCDYFSVGNDGESSGDNGSYLGMNSFRSSNTSGSSLDSFKVSLSTSKGRKFCRTMRKHMLNKTKSYNENDEDGGTSSPLAASSENEQETKDDNSEEENVTVSSDEESSTEESPAEEPNNGMPPSSPLASFSSLKPLSVASISRRPSSAVGNISVSQDTNASSKRTLEKIEDAKVERCIELVKKTLSTVQLIFLELVGKLEVTDRDSADLKISVKGRIDEYSKTISTIEVFWRGQKHTVTFPTPKYCEYLTEKTKSHMMDEELDLSQTGNEVNVMQQVMDRAPVFMAEMMKVYDLSVEFPLYRWMHVHILNLQWGVYGTAVLLCLMGLMSTFGKHSTYGYRSILRAWWFGLNDSKYIWSLIFSTTFAILTTLGYALILVYLFVSEVPVMAYEMKEAYENGKKLKTLTHDPIYDPAALKWRNGYLVFGFLLMAMHYSCYPQPRQIPMVYYLFFAVSGFLSLKSWRSYFKLQETETIRRVCLVYDVLVGRSFFRNRLLLLACCFLGFWETWWFSFLLLDVLNNSTVLGHVVKSISDNAGPLARVFFFFACTVVIYAFITVYFREDETEYDPLVLDDENQYGCHSAMSCMVLIVSHGVTTGTLMDVFDTVTNRRNGADNSNGYLARVLFELSFFIWVGIFLFNIVTGLMVDGFSRLRLEKENRKNIRDNTCLVCGCSRIEYDKRCTINEYIHKCERFNQDINHDVWKHLDNFVYLNLQNKTELNGVESYVWDQIKQSRLDWIPSKTSPSSQGHE